MGSEETVISTKLDILIVDFQRFRECQTKEMKEIFKHSVAEDTIQAKILTTQKWHTVIGSFMMSVILALVYVHIGGK